MASISVLWLSWNPPDYITFGWLVIMPRKGAGSVVLNGIPLVECLLKQIENPYWIVIIRPTKLSQYYTTIDLHKNHSDERIGHKAATLLGALFGLVGTLPDNKLLLRTNARHQSDLSYQIYSIECFLSRHLSLTLQPTSSQRHMGDLKHI